MDIRMKRLGEGGDAQKVSYEQGRFIKVQLGFAARRVLARFQL